MYIRKPHLHGQMLSMYVYSPGKPEPILLLIDLYDKNPRKETARELQRRSFLESNSDMDRLLFIFFINLLTDIYTFALSCIVPCEIYHMSDCNDSYYY